MKKNQSVIIFLFTLLFSVSFITAVSAQEKENKSCGSSCCDGKTKMMHQEKMDDSTMNHSKIDGSTMDHSMMDHQKMDEKTAPRAVETAEISLKKVDDNIPAWNTVCPVSGEEVDPQVGKIEYNGKIYGFCCNNCIRKFEKDPEKFSANLSDDGKSFVETH